MISQRRTEWNYNECVVFRNSVSRVILKNINETQFFSWKYIHTGVTIQYNILLLQIYRRFGFIREIIIINEIFRTQSTLLYLYHGGYLTGQEYIYLQYNICITFFTWIRLSVLSRGNRFCGPLLYDFFLDQSPDAHAGGLQRRTRRFFFFPFLRIGFLKTVAWQN